MSRVALIALLILASCGGDSQTTEPPGPAPTLTTIGAAEPESTAPTTSTTTTVAPATTSTTTSTLPPNAAPEFRISQVVFGEASFVIITNWGNESGSLDGYWLSQAEAFQALPDISLSPSEQALIGLAPLPPPDLTGMATVFHLGPAIGFIAPEGGEVALHDSDQFDDSASLVAYVEWGRGAHARSDLAQQAGIWDGTRVVVFDDAPSISTGAYPATSGLDWSADIGG